MRSGGGALLIIRFGVASCDDSESTSSQGTLIVSASTTGHQPDPDGYVLTVDGVHSLTPDLKDSAMTHERDDAP